MKIAFLCNYSLIYLNNKLKLDLNKKNFHPTTWIKYLIDEFKNRSNFNLYIITVSPYIKKTIKLEDNNIKYYIIKSGVPILNKGYPNYFRFDVFTNYFIIRKKILKILENENFDIVIAHGTEDVFSYTLNEYKGLKITWIQGLIHSLFKQDKSAWIKKQLFFEKEVFRKQKYFILNIPLFDYIIKKENKNARIFYLSYPISPLAFNIEQTDKKFDISFAGFLIKRKGVEDIIEAIRIIKSKKKDIKVNLIGGYSSQNYLNFLKQKVKDYGLEDNIFFGGYLISHEEVLRQMSLSKIFLFPTYMDTGPRSVAESLAMGIPVVAYKIDALPWMLGNNERGLLVEKGDIEGLAECCNLLLDNSDLRKKMGENGKIFSKNNFYPTIVVDKLIKIYNELLGEKS